MIVGMDFGTTNSGMAVYDGRHLDVLPLDPANNNPRVARTALYITNQKRVYIGRDAIDKYYAQNLNRKVKFESVWVGEVTMTFAELPEFVRDVYIEKDVLSPGRLFLSFKTSLSASHYFGTAVGTDFYFIEDIAALYLYVAKRRAERHLGQKLNRIVLGRPVRFNVDPQKDSLAQQRLLRAAFRAGYDEVYFQHEPLAAAYFYETTIDREQNVLVFDFGGGTLDISIARLGNPKTRQILATGGIPIAGDIFDQKLVRAKLPDHFGEGGTYRADDGSLRPIPSHYFEAFSNWQSILELNTPKNLQTLEQIEHTASNRRRIRALLSLISSSYGLKIFDAVEAIKCELSQRSNGLIRLDGPGFQVMQLVTRLEFERLIQQERTAIETLLDDVIAQAGLVPHQIDAVIRTGGSSQIPVFIEMLRARFGDEKIRSIDTFSSVTSGLGIIAHEIESGRLQGQAYYADEWNYGSNIAEHPKAVQPVDLDIIKKFVDLQESGENGDHPKTGWVVLTQQNEIEAAVPDQNEVDLTLDSPPLLTVAAPSDEKLLLMTSEYRFMLKTPQELADMRALGLRLVQTESLRVDEFGEEFISGAHRLPHDDTESLLLITTSGYVKTIRADTILPTLDRPTPFRLETMSGGYPAALITMGSTGSLLVMSRVGNLIRVLAPWTKNRIIKLTKEDRVTHTLYLPEPAELMIINEKGLARRFPSNAVPFASDVMAGSKLIAGAPRGLAVYRPTISILTTQRILTLEWNSVPLDQDFSQKPKALVKLDKGENVLGIG